MAEEFKAAGNALFVSHDYAGAVQKYSAAIELDNTNAVLYANRSACYHLSSRPKDGLADATKATELDPAYSKGWYRKGACEDALGRYPESIESYQKAIDVCAAHSPQIAQCRAALRTVQNKIMDPNTMSVDTMNALARAHDIPLPTSPDRDEIWQALSSHPRFGTEPKLRLLLIPQAENQPLKSVELVRGPDIRRKIARLLGCSLVDSVVLHSEDQVAYAQGKLVGVGIGRLHRSYEAWMDDSALSTRPLNARASRLLHRPNTHGPILVQKTTFIKSDADPFGKSVDIISFDKVDEQELLGDHFKNLRAEWVHWKGVSEPPLTFSSNPDGTITIS